MVMLMTPCMVTLYGYDDLYGNAVWLNMSNKC